jgi:hypothetical protein
VAETALLSEPSDLDLDRDVGIGLTDLEKSAVVMLSIGEDAAAEVMKHLTQLEINQLSLAMARVSNVSKGEVTEVFQQFIDAMLDESSIGIGSSSYVQGVLERALGTDRDAIWPHRARCGPGLSQQTDPQAGRGADAKAVVCWLMRSEDIEIGPPRHETNPQFASFAQADEPARSIARSSRACCSPR